MLDTGVTIGQNLTTIALVNTNDNAGGVAATSTVAGWGGEIFASTDSIYLASSDWNDTGECHNYDKVHPSGRVYKVTFGQPAPQALDLARASDEELS